MRRYSTFLCAYACCLAAGGGALAQTLAVDRIPNPAATIGRVTSAASGDTVFRIESGSGSISRVSGSGARLTSASSRALIVLSCMDKGKTAACDTTAVRVQIGAIGDGTGRARALSNFNVTADTAVIGRVPRSADVLTFTMEPMPSGESRSFYLGADFTVAGDEAGTATGTAAAGFYVMISAEDGSGSATESGLIEAQVLRPLSITAETSLDFGTLIVPASGTGSVSIDPARGTRTLQGVQGLSSPSPRAATFTVTGEGAQTFSVNVPQSFQMKAPGATIVVTTAHNADGPQRLDGRAGAAGSASFAVGGSFELSPGTRPGSYAGVFTVSVEYN